MLLVLALLLRAMDLVRIFDQIFILTQGGPGTATETVSLYIYRTAFRFTNFGYAAAMSFVLLAATGLLVQFGLQAVINMASTLHLMPTKGMTLPFISYGGSSMLALGLGMGMTLALTRRRYGGGE